MMTNQRSVDSFLDSDDDDTDNSPVHKKRKIITSNSNSINNDLYIMHIGPFDLPQSEVNIRRFLINNELDTPCDLSIQIRNKKVFAYTAYNTPELIHKFDTLRNIHRRNHKTITLCELIDNNYNKHSQLLYDRSSYSTQTNWIQMFGINLVKDFSNKDEKNWITKLLKWQYKNTDFNILTIKTFHNVRYSLTGFAFIELENNETAEQLVNYFQNKFIEDKEFKYWIDFVNTTNHLFINNLNENKCEQHTKQLLFENLYWKTSKSSLKKHINSVLSDCNLTFVNIKVNATCNGYPIGNAIVTFKSIEEAELVQSVCDGTELFDEVISVCFYKENECEMKEEQEIDSDIDSDNAMETEIHCSESESDYESSGSDGDGESDMGNGSDSDSDGMNRENGKDRNKLPMGMRLRRGEIMGLWKWKNPKKKMPRGLLCKKRKRINWKELNRKDWMGEWKKRERIDQRHKYSIRSGKLVLSSKKWRDRETQYRKKGKKYSKYK